jgi:hypothetical protein
MADLKGSAATLATVPLDGAERLLASDGALDRVITLNMLRDWLGIYSKRLTADQSNSTVTPTKVTGLDLTLPVGTYYFNYTIRYQAAATTTGVRFDVNFSGAVTTFLWNQYWMDTSSTASTAVPDQDSIPAAGSVVGGFSSRAKGTAGRGTTLSVDTANSDMLMIIEGLAVVTVTGDMQLYHGSEVAFASTVKAESVLVVQKVT